MAEAAAIPAGMKTIGEWFPIANVRWRWAGSTPARRWAQSSHRCWPRWWPRFGWQAAFIVTGALGVLFAARGIGSIARPMRPMSRKTGRNPRRAAPRACGRHQLARHRRNAALLGHCRAALSGRTCVADLLLWIPLYLAKERGMDLTQIALFAWVPFLAADAGGMLGGYLAPLLQRWLPQP
jgi:ACS family hexuronate transporter-like MFS transporter